MVAHAEPRTQAIEPARRSSVAVRSPRCSAQRSDRAICRGRATIAQMDQASRRAVDSAKTDRRVRPAIASGARRLTTHAARRLRSDADGPVGLVAALARQGRAGTRQADHDRVREALGLRCRWRLRVDVEDRRRRPLDRHKRSALDLESVAATASPGSRLARRSLSGSSQYERDVWRWSAPSLRSSSGETWHAPRRARARVGSPPPAPAARRA